MSFTSFISSEIFSFQTVLITKATKMSNANLLLFLNETIIIKNNIYKYNKKLYNIKKLYSQITV